MDATQFALDYLMKKGYKPHQAAGIVGNFVQESGVNPTVAPGDNGRSFGIAQWNGPRLDQLQSYAAANGANWRDLPTQLNFVDHELNTTEKAAGDAIRAAGDVRAATAAAAGYERPQGYTAANPEGANGWSNRLAAASQLAGMFAPVAPAAAAAPDVVVPSAAPQAPSGGAAAGMAGSLAEAFRPTNDPIAVAPAVDPTAGLLASAFSHVGNTVPNPDYIAAQKRKEALLGGPLLGSMFG